MDCNDDSPISRGLAPDSPSVGHGDRKSNLCKAQSKAKEDIHKRKKIMINRALRGKGPFRVVNEYFFIKYEKVTG